MDLITWTNELSVGIDSIDEQHKKLINLINNLNYALLDGSSKKIIPEIFDALAVYTLTHFVYEESLFNKYGYEFIGEHEQEHKLLIEQIKQLQEKMHGGDFMIGIEVMTFLKDWLTNHILKTDMAYSKFLIEQGAK